MVAQVLQRALAGGLGLDGEGRKGHHREPAVLDLLGLGLLEVALQGRTGASWLNLRATGPAWACRSPRPHAWPLQSGPQLAAERRGQ